MTDNKVGQVLQLIKQVPATLRGVISLYIFFLKHIPSFRRWTFNKSLFAISCLLIVINVHWALTLLSMFILIAYLTYYIYKHFYHSFTSDSYLTRLVMWMRKTIPIIKQGVPLEIKETKLSQERKPHKLASILQLSVCIVYFSRLCCNKIDKIEQNCILEFYLFCSFMLTIITTVFVFSFEYYGACSLIDKFFLDNQVSYFTCLYYSFNTLLHVGYGTAVPHSMYAKLLTATELAYSLLIFIFLFFILTTILRKRYRDALRFLHEQLNDGARQLEELLFTEFQLSLADATEKVKKDTPLLAPIVDYLSRWSTPTSG